MASEEVDDAFCASRHTATRDSSSKRKALGQPVVSSTKGGASLPALSRLPQSTVAAARSQGGDEALRAAWEEFGRQDLYNAPVEQELRDLGDLRHRRRGERSQRRRLKRGWLRLQRFQSDGWLTPSSSSAMPGSLEVSQSETLNCSSRPMRR